jgi:hypothetical protein
MEEHEDKLEKECRFPEAADTRKKINDLKAIEEKKVLSELLKVQEEEKTLLEGERDAEISKFNDEHDFAYTELVKKYEDLQAKMNETHMNEFNEAMREFNESFPDKNPKLTPELLNLQKVLEGHVKKKE